MSTDKSMLDRLMAMPRKELVDDVVFYHDGWIAAGRKRNELKAENKKLRKELAKWERLAAGIDLPKYPVTQFKPKDLERENKKLRELVKAMTPFLCCMPFASCNTLAASVRKRMIELGIEVPK